MSKLNCWPGCLARITTTNPIYKDKIVEVLYLAPVGRGFILPNGVKHASVPPNTWVIRFPSQVPARDSWGQSYATNYGSGPDERLRPITPPPNTEITDVDVPEVVEV